MAQDRLEKIETRLTDIQTGICEIRAIYEAYLKRLERVEDEVFGNGHTGLAPKVNTLIYGVSVVGTMVSLIFAHTISVWLRG